MKRFFCILGFSVVAAVIATIIYFFARHDVSPEHASIQHEEIMETHSNLKKTAVFPGSFAASSNNEKSSRSSFIASSTASNRTKRKDYKKTDGSLIQENFSLEMDTASLISFILDQQTSEDSRSQALDVLLNRVQKENDRNIAFEILIDVKDAISGEDQQFVLKALAQYSDLGANEAIAETFFNTAYTTTDLERCRMLTYLDPRYSMDEYTTDRFTDAYLQNLGQELKRMLLETIATACGEEGVYWIIDQTRQAGNDEMSMLIDALSRSGSELALDHLHQLINTAEDAESKEHIRRAIFQLKNQSIE